MFCVLEASCVVYVRVGMCVYVCVLCVYVCVCVCVCCACVVKISVLMERRGYFAWYGLEF